MNLGTVKHRNYCLGDMKTGEERIVKEEFTDK
jgi:hypothetical protein